MDDSPHPAFLENQGKFPGESGMFQYNDNAERAPDMGYGFRGESHNILLPMKVNPEPSCQFLNDVLDECYQSRFYSRALEYYLLESETHSASNVHCLLSGCTSNFPNAKEMLRHLKGCPHFPKGRFNCPTCDKSEKFRTVSKKKCSWNRSRLSTKIQNGIRASAGLFSRFSGSKPTECPRCHLRLREEPRTCGPPTHSQEESSKLFEMNMPRHSPFNPTTMNPEVDKGSTGMTEYFCGSQESGRTCELEGPIPSEAAGSFPLPAELSGDYRMSQPTIAIGHRMTSTSSHRCLSNASPTDISSVSTDQEATVSSNVSPSSSTSNRVPSSSKTSQKYSMGILDQHPEQRLFYGLPQGFASDLQYTQPNGSAYAQHMPISRDLGSSSIATASNYLCPMVGQTGFQGARQPSPLTIETGTLDSQSATWGPDTFPPEFNTPVMETFKFYSSEVSSIPIRRCSSITNPFPTANFKPSTSPLSTTMASPADLGTPEVDMLGKRLICQECGFVPHGKEENLQAYLNKHIKSHEGSKVKCPQAQCDKEFTRQDNATQHFKRVHRGSFFGRKRPVSSDGIQLVPNPKKPCG